MMHTYFDIMADILWSNGPLSGLNRSNDNNLLYNRSCTEVLMSCEGISTMKNTTVFEGYNWK